MKYKIVIQEEAIEDIRAAFIWYEEQRANLGFELLAAIEDCYEKISLHPNYYGYINEYYRRIKTNRFPYFVIYETEDDKVVINSVRHTKQKSKYS